ncbi:MAG: S8 family serine peptidase, partial [Phycisphaerales bacterium]
VEFQGEYTERSNANVRSIVQSGALNNTPLYNRGLHGEGQIVGLIDSDLNKDHCSFSDTVPIGPNHRKILAYNTFFGSASHGTHVGGTLCGDAGTAADTRGVAYAAKMVYNYYPDQNEPSVFGELDLHASQGARMHNNSWGDSSIRTYDGACHAIDSLSHDQEDNLIVFAVTDFNIPVTNPENAKNCLAVAASGGNNTMGQPSQDYYCAGGISPTVDGRRKPEIMAPGCGTISANNLSTCGTISNSGTSMAAPAVTGVGALVRQYYQSGFYPSGLPNVSDGFSPTGQLVKATLINSAVDITGESGFPSNREGWGRVLADNATYFVGDLRRLIVRDVRNTASDALSTGSSVSLPVRVAPGQPLKITLAWADAPGAVNATFTPVNNLDLVVTSPTGLVYYGNNLAAGESATGGSADSVNNLEQVLVTLPVDGVWTVDVTGTAVNMGPQGYALVVTGGVSEVVCLTDYNQDGNSDQSDIDAIIQDIAAGTASFPPNDPDVNHDGNLDAGDIDYLLNAIAGGGCP